MQRTITVFAVLFGTAISASAHSLLSVQDGSWVGQTYSGYNIAGPFHRPIIVKNEYGTSDQALLVYKDKMVEMYVPDVTDEHGYMRLRELYLFGQFTTLLYMYDQKSEQTISHILRVDVPKKTISVRTDAFADATVFTFTDAPYAISHAITNVVQIMQREIAIQHVQR